MIGSLLNIAIEKQLVSQMKPNNRKHNFVRSNPYVE